MSVYLKAKKTNLYWLCQAVKLQCQQHCSMEEYWRDKFAFLRFRQEGKNVISGLRVV